jgi:hypothetical protein
LAFGKFAEKISRRKQKTREKEAPQASLFLVSRVIWTLAIMSTMPMELRSGSGPVQPFARQFRSIFIASLARFSLECVPIRAA